MGKQPNSNFEVQFLLTSYYYTPHAVKNPKYLKLELLIIFTIEKTNGSVFMSKHKSLIEIVVEEHFFNIHPLNEIFVEKHFLMVLQMNIAGLKLQGRIFLFITTINLNQLKVRGWDEL